MTSSRAHSVVDNEEDLKSTLASQLLAKLADRAWTEEDFQVGKPLVMFETKAAATRKKSARTGDFVVLWLDQNASGSHTLPAKVTRKLQDVIADVVNHAVDDAGGTSSVADPAIERIALAVERTLPRARREYSEAHIERLVSALVEIEDPIAQASAAIDLDNARARHRFMSAVATLTAEDVAQAFGSVARNRHQLASRWKGEGKTFAISWQGLERYPAFQFREGKPLPVIAEVIAALPRAMSAWERAFWFVSANGSLGGAAPRDLLGEGSRVVAAARAEDEAVIG